MKKYIYKFIAISLLFSIINVQFVSASSVTPVDSSLPVKVLAQEGKVISPSGYEALTPLYQVSLDSKLLAKGKTFFVNISYESGTSSIKKVFYFDNSKNEWRPLPTVDNTKNKTVKVEVPFTFVRLAVFSKIINSPVAAVSQVESKLPIKVIAQEGEITPLSGYEALTPIYQVSLNPSLLAKGKTYSVSIPYSTSSNNFKKVFYFDNSKNLWRPLPTVDNTKDKTVKVEVPFTFVRLAVFSDTGILTVGDASWYSYKGGLFAASPDFLKGTVLRVYNLDNGKSVEVTVNDFGPNRALHPTRVVDLDKVAFSKIALTSVGTIKVRVEVVKSVGQILSQSIEPSAEPIVTASSAVIMRESDAKILWDKNGDKVAPLASLTKIVAAQVFLDTKPTLSRVVTYKQQDEDYNYKYCKPGESAKLTVKDGETMTLNDLLYSALVGSANNAVESLVRNSGLTRDEFISKMNAKVKSWGANSTSFIEPTGLSEFNVSSPSDYAIITKQAYTNPIIKKISTTTNYSFSTINTTVKHNLKNTNPLIAANKFDIIGSKTGYLNEAGYCLMTRVSTVNGNLIIVNFGSNSKANNFSDNEKLISYGLQLLKK